MSAEVVSGGGGGGVVKKKQNEEVEEEEEDMVQQQLLPYLGEDIITRILLKIPAESLFDTFRYVCKSWLNIISTHPDIHLNRLLPSKPPCLIIQNVDKEKNLTTCFFTLSKEGKIEEQFDDLNPVLKNLWIRACCNGLILASAFNNQKEEEEENYYVVNPLTNHRVILPPLQPIASSFSTSSVELVFIPSTGEYKVIVEVFFFPNKDSPPATKFLQILTLSVGDCYGCSSSSSSKNDRLQWRLIEALNQSLIPAIAINGILYWDCFLYWDTSIANEKQVDIVSFDASIEKFFVTTCIHGDDRASRGGYLGLIEMGGLPSPWSILREHDDVWRLSVRVVKDFREEEWIDNYSIRIDTDFMKIWDHRYPNPILSFGNGEVLIFHNVWEKTLWALNVKLNQWWKVGNKNLKEKLRFCFHGFHVNNKPVPLESIFAIEV